MRGRVADRLRRIGDAIRAAGALNAGHANAHRCGPRAHRAVRLVPSAAISIGAISIGAISIGASSIGVPSPAIWCHWKQAAATTLAVEVADPAAFTLSRVLAGRHAPAVPLLRRVEVADVTGIGRHAGAIARAIAAPRPRNLSAGEKRHQADDCHPL